MNHRFPHSRPASGTTLIEVLAGLVILSTLLVSLSIARGRFLRQWKQADQRLTAIAEADHLVEQWITGSPQAVPLSSTGITDDRNHHLWKTRIIPSPSAAVLGSVVVRLEVFERSADESPLTNVDFLLQNPRLLPGSK